MMDWAQIRKKKLQLRRFPNLQTSKRLECFGVWWAGMESLLYGLHPSLNQCITSWRVTKRFDVQTKVKSLSHFERDIDF